MPRTFSGGRAFLALPLALLLALVSLPLMATAAHADIHVDGVDTQQPDDAPQVLPVRCTGQGYVMPTEARACRITRYAGRPTVVVWGDSHSWQQTPAIIARARATRTNLITFQLGSCPPMDLRRTDVGGQCARLGELALRAIARRAQDGRVTVVLGGAWGLYADLQRRLAAGREPPAGEAYLASQAALSEVATPLAFRALNRLRRVHVVGLAQMPMQPRTAAEATARSAEPEPTPEPSPEPEPEPAPERTSVPRQEAIPREQATSRWLTRRVDRVVDATRYVCDVTRCYAEVAGMDTWLDALHINPRVAVYFEDAYASVFRR